MSRRLDSKPSFTMNKVFKKVDWEHRDRRGIGHRRGKGRRWEFYSEAGEIGETKG